MISLEGLTKDQQRVVLNHHGYITGKDRSAPEVSENRRTHLYKGTFDDPGLPMCKYGWNRDGGTSYSIWRNNISNKGVCKLCLKRANAGLDGVDVDCEEEVETAE